MCITATDGVPVACRQSVEVCDDGEFAPHTVTLTVTDSAGQSDSCDAGVTIIDETVPIITCPPDIS